MKRQPAARRKPHIEEIEPRILYSADTPLAVLDTHALSEQRTLDASGEFAAQPSSQTTQAQPTTGHEVVFVDTSTPDYQKLVEDIKSQSGANRQLDVVLLDPNSDGIKQISATLAGMQDVSAVHLIGHGADGQIELGGTTLNFDSLLKNAGQIKGWGQALTPGADLLIYGCDVAEYADGKALIDALGRLTGADVAASENLTGAADKGGDWNLEYRTGTIQTGLALSAAEQSSYDGLLASSAQGSETKANTTTSGTQESGTNNPPHVVAMDASGNYVVVWDGNGTQAGQADSAGIFFQRYNANGVAQGSETRVNTTTTDTQQWPSVAMDANGNFVIAWTSANQDGSGGGVYAQRYNASGVAQGGEFRVNSTTANDEAAPVIAMSTNGFVIAWNDSAKDGGGYGVYAQRYNASGGALGGEFRVNVTTAGDQWVDSAAMDASGNFIISWSNGDENASPYQDVYFRRYNSSGTALTGEVRANTTTTGDQNYSGVAMNASGAFLITWDSSDGSNDGIYAQRYDSSGTAQGSEFRVNTTTSNEQHLGRPAIDDSGNFVVVWDSYNQDAANTWGVYKQEYNADGSTNGGQTRVNTTTAGDQVYPSIAMNGVGQFVVAWSGDGPSDSVTSYSTSITPGSGGTVVSIGNAGGGMFFQRYATFGVTVTPTSGLTTTEASGTASFTVRLDAAPTANVTIALASSDTTEGTVSAGSLTFTTANWNVAQTVTVTGVDDALADGNIGYTIVTGTAASTDANYNGMAVANVSVTNSDTTPSEPARTVNEDNSLVFSAASGNAVNVTDGTTADSTLKVLMTVTNGVFTLSQTTGLTFVSGANGSSTMTVQGLESNINAALNGATYTPTANYNGSANLQLTTTRVPDATAEYTFENSGSLGTDAMGSYNASAVSGTSATVDAAHGNVASMSGAGYVQVNGHFGNPTSVTLGAWVNLTAADTSGAEVISLGDTVALRLDDSVTGGGGGVEGFVYNGSIWQNVGSGQYIAGTGWHYVAFTYDNTSKAAAVYLDGTVVASATLTGSPTYNQGANSFIGKHANGNANFDFNGKIDDARVYNRALSAAEIAELAADANGPTQSVAITVNAVNDAPTRTSASVSLAAVAEDTANPAGATVSSLFTSAFSDATDQVSGGSSANTLAGVAVTADAANSGTEGRWQWYNGTAWVNISTSVSTSSALVLASGTSVRFLPNADYNGTPGSLTVQLIDNSSGAVTSGNTVNVTTSGGTTQYSNSSNAVTLTTSVTPVNDAPVLSGSNNLSAINEDPASNAGTLVSSLVSGKITDVDSAALTGIAVTGVVNTNGTWQYSTNGGSTWSAFGSPGGTTARLLAADANTYVRFVPNANFNGTVSNGLTFRAWDQTSGTAGNTADTTTNGGTSAFSTATASASITVNSVNDAPAGTNKTVTTLEDTGYTFGTSDFGFSDTSDSPANTLLAVKIATLPGAGSLTDNGVAVTAGQFVSVTDINSGKLIFTPGANANGAGYASFTFQVQDNGGTGNGGVDLDPSARTMTINVSAVNDAPVLSGSNNLSAINEDPASNAGTLVSSLVSGKITDVDSAALTGIAVTGVVNTNGTWQYSTNGGSTWSAFGSPGGTTARLLAADANTYVRFVPNANFNGTVSNGLTFRAWDQTSGTAGNTADTTTNGGTSAFSTATASASITVNSVNDAPAGTNKTVTTLEDSAYTFAALDFGFSDTSDTPANSLLAVKITTLPGTGTLSDNGVAVTAGQFVTVADITGGKLTFTPGANAQGAAYASFTFQVQDDGGVANGGVDLDPSARTMTVNVTGVNDAPQGTSNTVTALEDNAYTFAAVDFGFSDPNDSPANTLSAVKITTIPGTGTLTDNGVAVTAGQFVSVTDINSGKLIFTPAANANGAGYASFTFQVQDNGGTANGGVDTDPVARTMNINVTAINDAPVLSGTEDLSAISENPVSNSGTLVSALISGQVSDADTGALSGIAVTAVDNTNGTWQYSTDGGATWNAFGATSAASARLLAADANTYVRFVPNLNWSGTVSGGLTFRAWDQTTGTAGGSADTTTNGGSSAYSAASASASITVNAVGLPTASNDAYSVNEDGTLSVDWWNSDWSKRSAITLSGNTFVGATNLTDFPVLVTLNSGNFDYSAAKADGSDLRLFDAGGNALAYEIEDWNAAGNSYVWVKVPQVNTTGTQQIQMYYGNLAAADGQNAAAVWTQSYSAVYHLDDPSTTAVDSSADGYSGTAMNGASSVAGVAGEGISLNGSSQYIALGNNRSFLDSANAVTLSAWIDPASVASHVNLLTFSINNSGTPTGTSRLAVEPNGTNLTLNIRSDDGAVQTVSTTSNPLTAGVWQYISAVIDVQTDTVSVYVNGVVQTLSGSVTLAGSAFPSTPSASAALGSDDAGGPGYFVGQIDEARVATAGRSAAWIKAEYLSMTGGFLSVGAAQSSASATNGVLHNDTDTGSVNFGAALVSGPAHASAFTLNADGTFSYTPTANFAGTDTFTYQAVDAFNTSNSATVTITVNPVNDAPQGSNNTVTALEDTGYTFAAVDFGFSDTADSPANSLLAVKLSTTPGTGTLTDNGVAVSAGQFVSVSDISSGKLIFTSGANANGAGYASFTFQVQDDGGTANGGVDLDPSARTMNIDVTAVNDAPVLSGSNNLSGINEDPSSNAGTLVSALLGANVSDVDSGALSGIAVTAVDNSNGTWQYSTNGGGTWSAFGTPSTASARLLAADASTSVRFVPNANFNGTVSNGITFRAWDQTTGAAGGTADTTTSGGTTAYSSATAGASITVSSVNDAPSGAGNTVTMLEDTAYTFAAADFGFSDTADSPANSLLAVKLTTTPGTGTLTDNGVAVSAGQFVSVSDINTGKLIFTPGANASGAGYASFTFQVQDDGGTANSGVDLDPSARTMTMNVTAVNDAPQGASNTVTALEDSTYTFAVADFGFSDAVDSPANSLLAVKIGTVPGAGTLSDNGVAVTAGQFVSVADIAAGKLVFTPTADANGAGYASFTFQVQDDGGIANGGVDLDPTARTMNIDVTPVNDAPAGANNTVTTLEDTGYTFSAVDFGFSDAVDSPADSLLAVKITTTPGAGTLSDNGVAVTAGQFVNLSDINTGKLIFTPGANANGAGYASFTFQVQDDGGTANGGVDLDPSARTMSINVTAVNDAPQGANNTVTTLEDTAYTFAAVDFGFSDAADSPANALLAVKLSTTPGTGTLTDNGVAVTAGQFVSLSDINTGKLIFTPGANANGAGYASFTFQVQDDGGTANGGVDLDPSARTMNIDVTAVNDAPQGTSTTVSTLENTAYAFTAMDFGFGDASDSPANTLLAVRITTLPGAGSLTDNGVAVTAGQFVTLADITTGQLVFTPAVNANGAGYASFTFQVQDDGGTANGGVDTDPTARMMTINVTTVNNAPTGADNTVTTLEDTDYVFGTVDFGFTDPGDSPANSLAAVQVATLPSAGSLADNGVAVTAGQFVSVADIAGGKLIFTPAANANGAGYASFGFQVQDNGGTAGGGVDVDPTVRTMTIDVTAVDDAPVLSNNTLTISQGGSLILSSANLSATDIDSPVASLTFTVSNVTNGRFELVASPGVPVFSFTQAAIGAGQVRFVQNGSAAAPGYNVAVSDGTTTLPPNPVTIGSFVPTPVAQPTIQPVVALVAPMPVFVPAPQVTSISQADAPAPTASEQAPAPTGGNEAATDGGAATAAGGAGPVLSGGRPVVAEPVGTEMPVATHTAFVRLESKLTRVSLNPAPELVPAEMGLLIQGSEPTYMQFGPSTLASWSASTAFPDEGHGKERDQIQIIMETVEMGGIALSVGVVWWASRVGGLIGSLLASMPAWRHLDPLPIVGRDEEEEKWYEKQDADADADELAVSMVLEGGGGARTSAAA